jgi:hypothetical protein
VLSIIYMQPNETSIIAYGTHPIQQGMKHISARIRWRGESSPA